MKLLNLFLISRVIITIPQIPRKSKNTNWLREKKSVWKSQENLFLIKLLALILAPGARDRIYTIWFLKFLFNWPEVIDVYKLRKYHTYVYFLCIVIRSNFAPRMNQKLGKPHYRQSLSLQWDRTRCPIDFLKSARRNVMLKIFGVGLIRA